MTGETTAIIDDHLIDFFASFNFDEQEVAQIKAYSWDDDGLSNKLKSLKWPDYGQDFHLILFEVFVKPIPYRRESIRVIENYRRKEKSIGIPIILDNENFFGLNEIDRQIFFKTPIHNKLDLLREKIKRNKLDLDLENLINDIDRLLKIS
jgi:hypothetical protein